jgi:hypothetical protein
VSVTRKPVRVFSFFDAGFMRESAPKTKGMAKQGFTDPTTWRPHIQDWLARQGYPGLSDNGVLSRLYRSEINVDLRFSPDGRIEAKVGDDLNGYAAEADFTAWPEALDWLRQTATRLYPDSDFVKGCDP